MGHNDFTNNTEKNSSAQTMWDFFQQYTLDAACDTTLKWRPRIETESYAPKSHGWTMNSGTTLLKFGETPNTSTKQNVYRTLQFQTGKYKLCFKSAGEEGKTITVKIEKLTGKKNAVLNATVDVGEESVLPFEVTDGWGEYKITFTRPSSTDAITITDLAIHSLTDEEVAKVGNITTPNLTVDDNSRIYDISGNQHSHSVKGINIINNKKVIVNRK